MTVMQKKIHKELNEKVDLNICCCPTVAINDFKYGLSTLPQIFHLQCLKYEDAFQQKIHRKSMKAAFSC